MTISELITKVDELKPNTFTDELKISWIEELLAKIKEEVIDTHFKPEMKDMPPLYRVHKLNKKEEITGDTEIDIPLSHMDVAEYWLIAKIDLAYVDLERYANSMILFNNAYLDYRKWYNRTHMPKSEHKIKRRWWF